MSTRRRLQVAPLRVDMEIFGGARGPSRRGLPRHCSELDGLVAARGERILLVHLAQRNRGHAVWRPVQLRLAGTDAKDGGHDKWPNEKGVNEHTHEEGEAILLDDEDLRNEQARERDRHDDAGHRDHAGRAADGKACGSAVGPAELAKLAH